MNKYKHYMTTQEIGGKSYMPIRQFLQIDKLTKKKVAKIIYKACGSLVKGNVNKKIKLTKEQIKDGTHNKGVFDYIDSRINPRHDEESKLIDEVVKTTDHFVDQLKLWHVGDICILNVGGFTGTKENGFIYCTIEEILHYEINGMYKGNLKVRIDVDTTIWKGIEQTEAYTKNLIKIGHEGIYKTLLYPNLNLKPNIVYNIEA